MDRRTEIQQIVDEAYDRKWAETDRHGHRTGEVQVDGRWVSQCLCGWTPSRPVRHPRVAVGLHIAAAGKRAARACQAEIDRRMAETRRFTR